MLFFPDPKIRSIGIDTSDHVFRLIEIRRGPFYRRRLQLHRYAEERLPDGIVVNGEFKQPQEAIVRLKNLVRKAYGRFGSRGAVVSLPETRTFVKVINVKRPEKLEQLPAAILSEAELHIPTALADLYIDWQPSANPAGVPAGKPLAVTIGAAPKTIVDSYSSTFEAAGLVPVAFEIEAQSIVRSVIPRAEASGPEGRPYGIIDFGATRSSFIVFDRGTIQFTVTVPLSGDDITRAIGGSLGIAAAEAERTKRQCGLDVHRCGTELWRVMEPFVRDMTARILDASAYYRDHFADGRPLEQIILCGGGANMARIEELLTEQTGVPVRKADPWTNIDPGRSPLPSEIILSSTTAVGLALRHTLPDEAEPPKKGRKAARP